LKTASEFRGRCPGKFKLTKPSLLRAPLPQTAKRSLSGVLVLIERFGYSHVVMSRLAITSCVKATFIFSAHPPAQTTELV